jgi:sugar lactone lactonase YvrE
MKPARLTILPSLLFVLLASPGCSSDDEAVNDTGVGADGGSDIGDDVGTGDVAVADGSADTAGEDARPDIVPDVAVYEPLPLPAATSVVVGSEFSKAEGLAFNGEGEMFMVADTDVWRVGLDGTPVRIADLEAPVGLAAIGERDILVADFGPLDRQADGENDDGLVVRVTPEGEMTTVATGIPDPNFILVLPDGTFLVSDDFDEIIYRVDDQGTVSVFLEGILAPNGMVLSLDGTTLFVAQTFSSIDPLVLDNAVWSVPLATVDALLVPGDPVLLARVDGSGANDGVALDAAGMLYVAANTDGNVWRIDPATGETELAASGIFGVASLAFGAGEWDAHTMYATQLFGGRLYAIELGLPGAPVER